MTCGSGVQTRYRSCTSPPPSNGGEDCSGDRFETKACQEPGCAVDGNYTDWGPWSPCSETCENGTQIRSRNCSNPPPAFGGNDCIGPANETRECTDGPCPVNGNFTEWGPWGPCSKTCGNETETRERNCTNPPPAFGGSDCIGPSIESRPCFGEFCSARLYPSGVDANDNKLPNDDRFNSECARINLVNQEVPFFVRKHTRVYICRNGMLKFATLSLSLFPRPFPGPRNEDGFFIFRNNYILAPYWARISQAGFDQANNASTVYYHMYSRFSQLDKDVISRANYDVRRFQTNPSIPLFEAHLVLVVTWVRIYPPSFHRVKLANTFQAVLITDGHHTFSLFNYPENGIEWSTPTGRLYPVAGYNAGDRGALRTFNLRYSGTAQIQRIDQLIGNSNRPGVWFFRLERNPILSLAGKKCNEWSGQPTSAIIPTLLPCPCRFSQAAQDKRFYVDYSQTVSKRSNGTVCAYSFPSTSNRWVQQCCYTDIPGVGKVLTLGPPEGGGPFLTVLPGFPEISDSDGHEFCCSSSQCSLYYSRRPSRDCTGYRLRRRGLVFGDPHFTTLDNTTYTFNGLGEYTIVTIDDGAFQMQARTVRTSGRGLGTVFSAAAAKEQGTATVEARINQIGYLEVLIAGKPFDISSVTSVGINIPDGNITLVRDSQGSITVLFPSEITFTFLDVERTLAIAFEAPDEFKNRTKGLLGTWNDDSSDDFFTPDGTLVPADASPQRIHYEFGLKWQIESHQSLFTYNGLESPHIFVDLNYVPMFINNINWVNDSFRLEAERVCGNNSECLFDAAVTEDTSYGINTRRLEENNNEINREFANYPPKIHGPQVINATINQAIYLNVTAEHNSSEHFVFKVNSFPGFEVIANTSQYLVIRWKPISLQKVEPVFMVTDSHNSTSELRPLVVLCSCSNGTKCIEDEEVQSQRNRGHRFILLSCGCPAGRTGQYCEDKIDACVENNQPCFPGVKCMAVSSESNGTGYQCGPCPTGYSGNGAICEDVDECINANASRCDHSCINVPGSYVCHCNPGFTLDSDGIGCTDINECIEANDCMHNCSNLPGGRHCSCFEGFQVDPKDKTACIPISRCDMFEVGCQQVCFMDHGQPKCSCQKGYKLNSDGRTCDDINECTTRKHKCSQLCHNLDGSYSCSCLPGFNLSPDQMTCQDIDECRQIDVVYCGGSLEICINTPGSFHCECQDGFYRVNDTCEEFLPSTNGSAVTGTIASWVAVSLTIKDSDFNEWQSRLSTIFMDVVAQIAVDYCKRNENANCFGDAVLLKRSSSARTSLVARVHVLIGFPEGRDSDLLVAFYVLLSTNQGESYILNRKSLLEILKGSVTALSWEIKKEIYDIRAYSVDEAKPVPYESRMDTSSIIWIMIGVSVAVTVPMVIILVLLCRQYRRNALQQRKANEFNLHQWSGTEGQIIFTGFSKSTNTRL